MNNDDNNINKDFERCNFNDEMFSSRFNSEASTLEAPFPAGGLGSASSGHCLLDREGHRCVGCLAAAIEAPVDSTSHGGWWVSCEEVAATANN